MLEQIVRPYIAVNSFTRDPIVVIATQPEPDIGIRWGKPSKFVYSNQGKKPPSRPRIVSGSGGDDDNKLEEETEIVKLTGEAFKYTTKDEETGSIIQMTSQLVFKGSRIIERYDSQGRRQMPGNLSIEYYFNLTLNEPE